MFSLFEPERAAALRERLQLTQTPFMISGFGTGHQHDLGSALRTATPRRRSDLRKADRDMIAFELWEADGEDTFLGEGSTCERIKIPVDATIAFIEDGG